MKEKIIKKEDFITTKWEGGETNQLAIYPEDSIFFEKDFLWRISSASFTKLESKFTDFSGYQRYILPLEGKLNLYHQGLYNRELEKYEAEYFDGSWNTLSKNTSDCIDYNFIIKSGNQGKMQVLKEGDEYLLKGSAIVTIFSKDDILLNLNDEKDKRNIEGGSLLVLETKNGSKINIIKSNLPVIITEFIIII